MTARRLRLSPADSALLGAGALILLAVAFVSVNVGARVGAGSVVVVALFLGVTAAYIRVPHLALSATIVLFAFVPALKVFVNPQIGALKDLVCLSAYAGAFLLFVAERRRTDRIVVILVALFLVLYAVNAGGSHSAAWAQGVRLTSEPVLLLLVGLILPQPRRNLRYAVRTLLAVTCLDAAYGLLQQALGPFKLVSLGYSFVDQVRTIGPFLRSFGTLDDPFAYAAFLLFGIIALLFRSRRSVLSTGAGALLLLGLTSSFVRTSVLVLVGLVALLLIRAGRGRLALALGLTTLVVGALTLVNAGGTQTQAYAVYDNKGGFQLISRPVPSGETVALNGRASAWKTALGSQPAGWLLGRGVGKVGTAAARAKYTFAPGRKLAVNQQQAVDSGYLAVVADVGLTGLAVFLGLLARLMVLASRAARQRSNLGWLALGFLVALMLDAMTRASFTGFPTAFLAMLLIGLSIAGAGEDVVEARAASWRPADGPPARTNGRSAGLGTRSA